MQSAFRSANELLHELGVTSPQDIDIEAIAYYCGAEVRYERLDGCAARLIGTGERAIITVDSKSQHVRQRFSIAHELGHWMRDRGKTAYICSKGDVTAIPRLTATPETGANRYAADLLMPDFVFKFAAKGKAMTMDQVRELGKLFQTSITATAIRFVQCGPAPAMLVFHKKHGRMRFIRGPDVPDSIWPQKELSYNTSAFEVLYGDKPQQKPRDIDADEWVDHRDAGRYSVIESTVKISDDCVMSLIWWKNEAQLTDLEEDSG